MGDEGDVAEESKPVIEVREGPAEFVEHPAKLLRIASMVREVLDEVRQAPLDEGARKRLLEVHERSVAELKEILSEDLRRELDALSVPIEGTPSEAEVRVAQAQLVGWLEGLFHGIQAALVAQQLQARAQLAEMSRQALPSGRPEPGPEAAKKPEGASGQYL